MFSPCCSGSHTQAWVCMYKSLLPCLSFHLGVTRCSTSFFNVVFPWERLWLLQQATFSFFQSTNNHNNNNISFCSLFIGWSGTGVLFFFPSSSVQQQWCLLNQQNVSKRIFCVFVVRCAFFLYLMHLLIQPLWWWMRIPLVCVGGLVLLSSGVWVLGVFWGCSVKPLTTVRYTHVKEWYGVHKQEPDAGICVWFSARSWSNHYFPALRLLTLVRPFFSEMDDNCIFIKQKQTKTNLSRKFRSPKIDVSVPSSILILSILHFFCCLI